MGSASYEVGLTMRWSQRLAVLESSFEFMKQLFVFATLASTRRGSSFSR